MNIFEAVFKMLCFRIIQVLWDINNSEFRVYQYLRKIEISIINDCQSFIHQSQLEHIKVKIAETLVTILPLITKLLTNHNRVVNHEIVSTFIPSGSCIVTLMCYYLLCCSIVWDKFIFLAKQELRNANKCDLLTPFYRL